MKIQPITIAGAWNENLARMLDAAFRRVTSALGALTVRDNVAGRQTTIAYNSDTVPVLVDWTLAKQPRAVLAIRSTRNTTSTTNVSGAAVAWLFRNGKVEIHGISSLASSVDYEIDLLLLED